MAWDTKDTRYGIAYEFFQIWYKLAGELKKAIPVAIEKSMPLGYQEDETGGWIIELWTYPDLIWNLHEIGDSVLKLLGILSRKPLQEAFKPSQSLLLFAGKSRQFLQQKK